MSRFDVDDNEMPAYQPLDDAALEAYLTGRRGPADEVADLAAFADDLGMALSGPSPLPKADLAVLLADGFELETGDLRVPAAPPAWTPAWTPTWAPVPAPAPGWTSAPVPQHKEPAPSARVFRPRLLARLAGLGVAAKVTLGIGVATASVTGAGAAGVLPDPAQHMVATVVDTVTPFEFPDKPSSHSDLGANVATDATGASDGSPGVDGRAVADGAKTQGGPPPATPNAGGPANQGLRGLDRAGQTPAAGTVPTSVPVGVANPVSQGSVGLDRANQTPAAGHVPTSVPTPTSVPPQPSDPGTGSPTPPGLDRASDTPAAGNVPTSVGRP